MILLHLWFGMLGTAQGGVVFTAEEDVSLSHTQWLVVKHSDEEYRLVSSVTATAELQTFTWVIPVDGVPLSATLSTDELLRSADLLTAPRLMRYECEDLYPWQTNNTYNYGYYYYGYYEPYYSDTDIRPGVNSTFGGNNRRGPFSCGADRSRDPDAPQWQYTYGYYVPPNYVYDDEPDNDPSQVTKALFQVWESPEGSSVVTVLDPEASVAEALQDRGLNMGAETLAALVQYEAAGWNFVLVDGDFSAVDGPTPEVAIDVVRSSQDPIRLPLIAQASQASDGANTLVQVIESSSDGRLELGNFTPAANYLMCMWDGTSDEFAPFANDFLAIDSSEAPTWRLEAAVGLWGSSAEAFGWEGDEDAVASRARIGLSSTITADPTLLTEDDGPSSIEIVQYLDDLESDFRICGEGWAPNPGDCSDEMLFFPPQPTSQTWLLAPLAAAIAWRRRRAQA